MSNAPSHIVLKRKSGAHFVAEDQAGHRVDVEGPPLVGGEGNAFGAMQLVLVGLAGCMSVDVLYVLQKGRFEVDDLQIDIQATRKDEIPSTFDVINLHVTGKGNFSADKLERAVNLSHDKYCSVSKMLSATVTITASSAMME
ncbi:MAG: OsmC family protein [Deltaproteobacteria bacterium]|nr:OsmC family protein [Deltaproteobacteria bacterium]